MIAWLRRWVMPVTGYLRSPAFEDEEKNRAAGLAHRATWVMLLMMATAPPLVLFTAPDGIAVTLAVAAPFLVLSVVVLYLVHRGRVDAAGWVIMAMFYLLVTWSVFTYRGLRDLTITGYFVAAILATLLLRRRGAVIVSVVSAATMVVAFVAEANGYLVPELDATTPPVQLVTLLIMFGFTSVLMRFSVQGNEYAFGQLRRSAAALREANSELETSRDVAAQHAAATEQRSAYLQASSEVAHAVGSMLDVEQLLERVVDLIHERFGLYYVGIFMLDEAARGVLGSAGANPEWVNLRAGTGPAGKAMLARGHRLRVGEGMIGWAVAQGEARVAQEAHVDQVRVTTAELPETRAEAALPLISRGKVLGAITVQDTRPGAFDQEAVSVLQVLADQVAVALDNARLLRESQIALEAERRAYGEISARGWAEMLRRGRELGYVYRQGGDLTTAQGTWSEEMARAREGGETVVHGSDGAEGKTVAVPIKIRDRVMGVVRLQKPEDGHSWTKEELALMQTLTSQLEVALESARLYEDSQRRAAEERLIGEVMGRVRETLDVDLVLQTAIQEMGTALGLSRVEVRMGETELFPQSGASMTKGGEHVAAG
ncbi:MAG TPA: GAF domain-containing protein [Anaerolineae bacterium]|nr:GAF domain-containing protein [Anaerolineae bacterium]